MGLIAELKRRNVVRVGLAYILVAWLTLQAIDFFLEVIDAPNWVLQVFTMVGVIGLPVVLVFSWVFEITPEGIKREVEVNRDASITQRTGQKLNYVIIAALAVAVVYFGWDNFTGEQTRTAPETAQSVEESVPATNNKSIAVLPFDDMSQEQDQRWFADGLAEEILNSLARAPDLQVASRTSSFRFRDSDMDISEIAEQLGVENVLEGSVRASENRIRVTAQLIRASDGFHIWSETYDRDESDMIAVQEDLAFRIADALETSMDPEALEEMTRVGTRSVEAYKAYLAGISQFQSLGDDLSTSPVLAAIDHLERAIELDPRFSAAHYELANAWQFHLSPTNMFTGATDLSLDEAKAKFNESIDRAIDTATDDVTRRFYESLKAAVQLRIGDAHELIKEYLQARPNDLNGWFGYDYTGNVLNDRQAQRELREFFRSRIDVSSDGFNAYLFSAHTREDPSEVADFALDAARRWPADGGILYQAHRALLWAGRIEEAAEVADRFRRHPSNPDPTFIEMVDLRQLCAEGRTEEALALYDGMDIDAKTNPISTRFLSLMTLGQTDAATQSLMPYNNPEGLIIIADFLDYEIFDPTPFSEVMALLEREEIQRSPPKVLPYTCPPPEGTSIAVLPFVNMSADAENEYFSDGVSEEILNVLAHIPELKVAARTSAFAYKDTDVNVADIARELGVNHVLEGSVRKAGNQVRVTAQLIKADDGFHLWSENFDRELDDIFAIQDEIAGQIAEALKVTLELEDGPAGNLTGTTSLDAYEHFLRGMALWHERTAASLAQAIEEFEAAIRLDPQFARPYAGLALTWSVYAGYVTVTEGETLDKAMAAADKALALDPDNVEALISKAQTLSGYLDYEKAEPLYQRTLELNPSFATAYQWYGRHKGYVGDRQSELDLLKNAWELDPHSRIIGNNYAWSLWAMGRIDEAIDALQQVLDYAPDFPDALSSLMALNIAQGDCEAVASLGHRIAALLGKKTDSTPTYQALCEAPDEETRKALLDEIVSWGEFIYADPDSPHLLYDIEFWALTAMLGEFETASVALESVNRYWSPGEVAWLSYVSHGKVGEFNCLPDSLVFYAELNLPASPFEVPCD